MNKRLREVVAQHGIHPVGSDIDIITGKRVAPEEGHPMTTSTLTVTDFVLARIAEDEAVARAATDGPWKVDNETYAEYIGSPLGAVVSGGRWGGEASVFDSTADAIHIARHDPARVLAQCAAMRKIVELHELAPYYGTDRCGRWLPHEGEPKCWYCGCQVDDGMIQGEAPCDTVRALASIWSDHPDWREEWA